MTPDMINDLLHLAWGLWIAFCFVAFPLWLAPVMAILPREMEQTYHALDGTGLIEHVARWDYWYWKLRDLAGFLVGGLVIHIWR